MSDGSGHGVHDVSQTVVGEGTTSDAGYAAHGCRPSVMQGDYGVLTSPTSVLRVATEVLWLIKGLGPGGAERLLVNMATAGHDSNVRFTCAYVLPQKDHLVGQLEAAGVRCICLSHRARDLGWPWRLRSLLRTGRWAVVHGHSPLPMSVARIAAFTVGRSRRPVLVSTEHNAWGSFSWPTRWLNRFTSRLDAAVFAVSDETAASMSGPAASKVVTLQHGIDIAAVVAQKDQRQAVRTELGVGRDELVVGTVANYREQKDYPTLLRAAARLRDSGVQFRLVAVGQGPLEGEVERLRRELGLEHTVVLTGYRSDATAVMAAFDVFTLSSRYEGLPVALMEALAHGLPVVATEVGGVAETMRSTGAVLVPPGDPTALAAGWSTVLGDRALRERLATESAALSQQFDSSRAAAVVDRTYQVLAGAARAAEPQPAATTRRSGATTSLELREAGAADRPAILELCRATLGWGDDPRFERLFEWKHEQNAFGPSYCWVAADHGQVVGVRLFMRWEFQHGDRAARAVRAVDTATHPDHQGRGIFTALTLHGLEAVAADGVEFVFNTPNDKSRPGYLKMGWSEVGRLPAAVRLSGPGGAVRAARSRVPADLWPVASTAGTAFAEWLDRHPDIAPPEPRHSLQAAWTADRLAWRYSLPELGYRVLDHRDTSVVFRLRRRGAAMELVVCNAIGDQSPRAIDRAIGAAVSATGASYGLRLGPPALARGVVPLPGGGPILTWRGLGSDAMPSLADWDLTMGDIELF